MSLIKLKLEFYSVVSLVFMVISTGYERPIYVATAFLFTLLSIYYLFVAEGDLDKDDIKFSEYSFYSAIGIFFLARIFI